MIAVPHGNRSGRSSAKRHSARLFAGIAVGAVCCVAASAQDLETPYGDETRDEIWSGVGDAAEDMEPDDDSIVEDVAGLPSKATATGAVPPAQGSGGTPEDDPFAAPGIAVGSFILRPTLEIGLTGQRETTASKNGTPPVVVRSTDHSLLGDSDLRLQLDSDWERHELNVDVRGGLQRDLNGGIFEPDLSAEANGRLDISATTTLSGSIGYSYELDDPESPAYVAATDPSLVPVVTGVNSPATQEVNASLTLRQEFGRFFTEAGVEAARYFYGDAELSDGTVISQGDLDNTTIDGRLRAGIDASAVFSPFVEASYGVRRMAETPDSGGVDRNAERYGLRLGTGIDFGEKLNGEISAGYELENPADPALSDIAGAAIGAQINWSPRRETDVVLELETTTETSGASANGGAMLYTADLGVTHRLRDNLTAEAAVGAEYRHVRSGSDETTLNTEMALTYWFNRFSGLTTRIGHEETLSRDPADRSRTTSAYVGLRLRR